MMNNNEKTTLGLTLLICMTAIMSIAATKDIATRYLTERTRIVAQDTKTIPGKVITHYRKGKNSWATTNAITVINRVVDRPVKYSKLKLIVAAKAAGKWDDVKSAIKAMDLEDEWNACQFITSDYPAYIAATNAVVTKGIASEAEIKAFMRQAEDN
jgi:hypothetical protein